MDSILVKPTPVMAPIAVLPPNPRPAKPLLFDVTQFGALPNGLSGAPVDNTAPFQRALDAAGRAGGGEVYVPAGAYRLAGPLFVPSGAELRGCFDGPHHTMPEGSVLLATGNRGREHGTPFLNLMPGSGARGLNIWYPDQKIDNIAPYPWTVRSLGPGCWLIDLTVANAYLLADFGSYPSEGFVLRDLMGLALCSDVWVSKGSGAIDGCHFSPNFWLRPVPGESAPFRKLIDYLNSHLDALVIGKSRSTLQVNDRVVAARRGLLFIDKHGGRIINGDYSGRAIK
jgi:hypothetical protein